MYIFGKCSKLAASTNGEAKIDTSKEPVKREVLCDEFQSIIKLTLDHPYSCSKVDS